MSERFHRSTAWGLRLRLVATLAVLGAGVLIAVLNVFVASSAVPATCALCHYQERADLAETVHASLACADCHRGPGLFRLLEEKARFVGMIAESLQPWGDTAHSASALDASCVNCHEQVVESSVVARAIRVQHSTIMEGGMRCGECHSRVSHADLSGGGIEMRKCTVCHDGIGLSARCSICHVEGERRPRSADGALNSWRVTHSGVWRETHGMGNLDTCRVCHAPAYCVRCHEVELPHSSTYLRSHRAEALRSPDACRACHSGERCIECHDSAELFTHPEGFLGEHAELTRQSGDEACLRCHARSGCERCHSRHVHPGGLNPDGTFRLRRR